MDLGNWISGERCMFYSKECYFISNCMHYPSNHHFEMKYNWKDLLVDTAIWAVVLGSVALIVGSFPGTFSQLLPFLDNFKST